MNSKLKSIKNWMNEFLDNEVDHDERRLKNALDRVFDKALKIIDEKDVEIAQLTIDLSERDESIRRLEELVTERNEELLDLHAKLNGIDKPNKE